MSILKSLLGKRKTDSTTPRTSRKLTLETLEGREVPATFTPFGSAGSGTGFNDSAPPSTFMGTGQSTGFAAQTAFGIVPNSNLVNNGFGTTSLLGAGRLSEQQLLAELLRANVLNVLLGDLAAQQGNSDDIRNLGVQLRSIGMQGITALQPTLARRGIRLSFNPSDVQSITNLATTQGDVFDQQFANLANSQIQRIVGLSTLRSQL